MNTISLQITYRRGRALAAYIYLEENAAKETQRSERISTDLLVDFAPDGRPVGIEIVTPKAVQIEEILAVFDRLGLGRPSPEELAPLRAA